MRRHGNKICLVGIDTIVWIEVERKVFVKRDGSKTV